jgi:hypothetical protein
MDQAMLACLPCIWSDDILRGVKVSLAFMLTGNRFAASCSPKSCWGFKSPESSRGKPLDNRWPQASCAMCDCCCGSQRPAVGVCFSFLQLEPRIYTDLICMDWESTLQSMTQTSKCKSGNNSKHKVSPSLLAAHTANSWRQLRMVFSVLFTQAAASAGGLFLYMTSSLPQNSVPTGIYCSFIPLWKKPCLDVIIGPIFWSHLEMESNRVLYSRACNISGSLFVRKITATLSCLSLWTWVALCLCVF